MLDNGKQPSGREDKGPGEEAHQSDVNEEASTPEASSDPELDELDLEDQCELNQVSTLLQKNERTTEENRLLEDLIKRHGPQIAQAVTVTTTASFSGPLPPPSILRGYEQIVPGAAKRILDAADSEREHRHTIEKTIVGAETGRDKRGQYMALTVALAVLVLSGIALLAGHPWTATFIAALDVGGLVSAFIYGRRVGNSPTTDNNIPPKSE